jgi:hypothetical protein
LIDRNPGEVGFVAIQKDPLLDGGIGAILGALLMFFFIGPKILSAIVGDYFYSKK